MLDEEYKKLIDSWEVAPPPVAWDFIRNSVQKPWYSEVWVKAAVFSIVVSIALVSAFLFYHSSNTTTSAQNSNISVGKIGNDSSNNGNIDKKITDEKAINHSKTSKDNKITAVESQTSEAPANNVNYKAQSEISSTNPNEFEAKVNVDVNPIEPIQQSKSITTESVIASKIKPTMNLSSSEVCIGKLVNFRLDGIPLNSILDFGDHHQIILNTSKLNVPYTYPNPGVYLISVYSQNATLISREIIVNDKVQAYFKSSVAENNIVKLTNLSLMANSYYWIFDDGQTLITTDATPITHYYSSTARQVYKIKLIAINKNSGCNDTFETEVRNPNFKNYFFTAIPDVFTPNGDGLNDVFEIPAADLKEWHMLIVNEAGLVVFETNKQKNFWNGHINNLGSECSSGVYRYIIKYMQPDDDEIHQKAGFITLMR